MKNVGISLLITAAVLSFSFEEKKASVYAYQCKNVAITGEGELKAFVSRVLGQKDSPVAHVSLKKVTTGSVQEKQHIHEHLVGFVEK